MYAVLVMHVQAQPAMNKPPARAAARAAAAATLVACLPGAAAERLVLTKVSQLFLPFETGSDGAPRFCYDQGVAEQLTYHVPTQQAIVCGNEVRRTAPTLLCCHALYASPMHALRYKYLQGYALLCFAAPGYRLASCGSRSS